MKTKKGSYFLNLHEFVYTPVALEIFLNSEEDKLIEDTEPTIMQPEEKSKINSTSSENSKRGQPSLVKLFPTIVDVSSEFLKQHGFAAQCRRRNETGYSSGVSIKQIRNHLLENVPNLKERNMSLTSVRRLFEAPNKSFVASNRYKGYVNARVGTKSNCYRELHEDAHYLFARNKYRREFVSLYPKNAVMISRDDMAKVKVGPPAVSRYHQIKKMFLEEDQPNYPDHDFTVPGYLLNVSGYMTLEQKVGMFVFLSIFHFAFYIYLHWLNRLY